MGFKSECVVKQYNKVYMAFDKINLSPRARKRERLTICGMFLLKTIYLVLSESNAD